MSSSTTTSSAVPSKVFLNTGAPMVIVGLDGQLIDCNEAFLEIMGYAKEDMLSQSLLSITHPTDLPDVFRTMNLLLTGRTMSGNLFKRLRMKDGRFRSMNTTGWVVMDGQQPRHFVGVVVPGAVLSATPSSSPKSAAPASSSNADSFFSN
eukprot:TRINITY_DN66227_c6_g10_i1.p2 TRINITY_DN66227_c6_g10~~TRINITY_DN66227_c6_g10_i1.p2  ORF type:complete len:150 (+),score=85.38 TRINITY_DN66227_c6_g10_i1:2-451(+)